jgi:hypothetical protein
MTGSVIIDRAWQMLDDVGAHRRNPLAAMVAHLNDGLQDVIARRPYTLLQDDGTNATFIELTTSTYASQALPVGEAFREPLAHYVAARVFELDAADRHNAQLAQSHMQTYMTTS